MGSAGRGTETGKRRKRGPGAGRGGRIGGELSRGGATGWVERGWEESVGAAGLDRGGPRGKCLTADEVGASQEPPSQEPPETRRGLNGQLLTLPASCPVRMGSLRPNFPADSGERALSQGVTRSLRGCSHLVLTGKGDPRPRDSTPCSEVRGKCDLNPAGPILRPKDMHPTPPNPTRDPEPRAGPASGPARLPVQPPRHWLLRPGRSPRRGN